MRRQVSYWPLCLNHPTLLTVIEREPRTIIHVKRANMFDPMGHGLIWGQRCHQYPENGLLAGLGLGFHPEITLWSSASSRIRFLPVQAQPTAARSSRRAVAARSSRRAVADGYHIGRYFYLIILPLLIILLSPKIKLHYSISYCNKTKSNNLI